MRKSGATTRISSTFDAGLKFENVANEDLAIAILRVAAFGLGDSIALAYCLIFSQNKILSASAKRVLKLKLPEVRSPQFVADIPEEIRLAIFSLTQIEEVRVILRNYAYSLNDI